MKKTIQIGLYMMIASLILTIPSMAQDLKKEMADLTAKYEKAYNAKDVKTLVSMYTAEAVRDFSDGRHYSGTGEIEAAMTEEFAASSLKVSIHPGAYDVNPDGTLVSKGTYHLEGTAGTEAVNTNGSYTNTLVKVNGQWKITKSSLVLEQ